MADAKADAQQEEVRGTLPAGTRLRNYELISVLGQGGFGITYYARDTTLGREVAIKEYLPTTLALREATMVVPRSTLLAEDFVWGRDRFLEEARTLATLEGAPSVVRVYDFLEANGTAYMVMGLARGETLDDRLKRKRVLAPPIVEHLLKRLLEGLDAVHKAGFLHRDVKPANIILDASNNPTLIDFGASRASIADRTAAMTAIFTPRYAAAEQLTSAKQGPWTDIYGVSATLYHAITGAAPPSSLERALNDTYEPLSRLLPEGYSPAVLHGIDAGLAVRAKERPQSIAQWREVLSDVEESAADATVLVKSKPAAKRAVAGAALGTAAVEPPANAKPPALTSKNRAPRPVAPGRFRLYAVAAAIVVVLILGGYSLHAWISAPSSSVPSRDVKADQAEAARVQAEAEAQQRAQAQQRTDLEARQAAEAEAKAKADADARQRAEADAKARADAEAKAKAEADARARADAEAQQRAQADAKARADTEAKARADTEARQKAEAEAKAKADAQARQNAEADAAAQKAAAEAAETALRLSPTDRTRVQVALTSLGFDTHGADGVFGPHTREVIQAWQTARHHPATGFLTAPQQQALLSEAAPALAKYDDDQRKAAEAAARARAAAPVPAPTPRASGSGVSCQDTSGRRFDFPSATACPYGLTQVR